MPGNSGTCQLVADYSRCSTSSIPKDVVISPSSSSKKKIVTTTHESTNETRPIMSFRVTRSRVAQNSAKYNNDPPLASTKRKTFKRPRDESWNGQEDCGMYHDCSKSVEEQKSLENDHDDSNDMPPSPQYKRQASFNTFWPTTTHEDCSLPSDMSIEREPIDISRISIGSFSQELSSLGKNSARQSRPSSTTLNNTSNNTNSDFFSKEHSCHDDRTNNRFVANPSRHSSDPDESQQRSSMLTHHDDCAEEFKSNDNCDASQVLLTQGLSGLDNLGNTCFMNSALQCLVHTKTVRDFFTRGKYGQDILENSPMGGQLAENFAKICGGIFQQPSFSSVNPSVLKDVISKWAPQFTGHSQQDAHELLRFLLDGLSEDLKRNSDSNTLPSLHQLGTFDGDLSKLTPEEQGEYWWDRHKAMNSSFITDEFCGQLMSTIVCCECQQERYCFDPMYDLSLPMPGDNNNNNHHQMSVFGRRTIRRSSSRLMAAASQSSEDEDCSLNDCLEMFMKEEVLDGQNMSYCSKCKKLQKTHKRLYLNRLPNTLVLHLKRFGNSRRKKQNKISYPVNGLNLRPFLSNNTLAHTSRKSSCRRVPLYDLYAVCHHMGTSYSGHYTASCLDMISKEWYEFNDTKVSRHDGKLSPCNTPYMLFYKLRQ
jgi:ubiquitin carboxyl-terminal hydrolase 2/21